MPKDGFLSCMTGRLTRMATYIWVGRATELALPKILCDSYRARLEQNHQGHYQPVSYLSRPSSSVRHGHLIPTLFLPLAHARVLAMCLAGTVMACQLRIKLYKISAYAVPSFLPFQHH